MEVDEAGRERCRDRNTKREDGGGGGKGKVSGRGRKEGRMHEGEKKYRDRIEEKEDGGRRVKWRRKKNIYREIRSERMGRREKKTKGKEEEKVERSG